MYSRFWTQLVAADLTEPDAGARVPSKDFTADLTCPPVGARLPAKVFTCPKARSMGR